MRIPGVLPIVLLSLLTGSMGVSAQGAGAEAVEVKAGQFGDYQPKDFLSDYSNLQPEGGDSEAFLYRDPGVDISPYKKLLIDRIKIFIKDDAEYKGSTRRNSRNSSIIFTKPL